MQLVKLVGYGATVLSLAVSSGVAYADNDASNTDTGFDSDNFATIEVTNKLYVDVTNSADFDASLGLTIDTGDNDVKKNTKAGNNEGGDVDVNIDGSTEISQNSGLDCECLGDLFESGDNQASNEQTGAESQNVALVDLYNKADVDISNTADVDLSVGADIDTGNNDTEKNTKVGDTSSGDVSFSFNWDTVINQGN